MKTRSILIMENKKNKLELSINPSEISISDSIANIHENIIELGEISIAGKRGLKSVSLSTFIPASNSPFKNEYSIDLVRKLIDRWLGKETKLRIIITNPSINFKVLIDSATISLKEGSDDLYINLSFIEYKEIVVKDTNSIESFIDVGVKKKVLADNVIDLKQRDNTSIDVDNEERIEIVKKGTTLWSLAIKYYGDGKEWKKIAKANKDIDPKKLKEGIRLVIP